MDVFMELYDDVADDIILSIVPEHQVLIALVWLLDRFVWPATMLKFVLLLYSHISSFIIRHSSSIENRQLSI